TDYPPLFSLYTHTHTHTHTRCSHSTLGLLRLSQHHSTHTNNPLTPPLPSLLCPSPSPLLLTPPLLCSPLLLSPSPSPLLSFPFHSTPLLSLSLSHPPSF